MKNDLNRNKVKDEESSSDSPYEQRNEEQIAPVYNDDSEPGFFNKLFKYTLILAACVAIPFAVNNDLWSDMKGAYNVATMLISDGDNSPEQTPVAPPPPPVPGEDDINQIIREALGDQGNYTFSTSGERSIIRFSNPDGESYNVVKDADGNVIIENITGPPEFDGNELSRRIEEEIASEMAKLEEELAGLDQQTQNATAGLEQRIEEAAQRMVKQGPNGEIIIDQQALKEITENATQLGLAVSGQVLSGLGNQQATTIEGGGSENYLDFLSSMKSAGLYDDFAEWELSNFHDAGLTADQIQEWSNAGLFEDLQSYEVVSLIEDGVTPEVVNRWKESGLFDRFQSYELSSMYQDGIDAEDTREYLAFADEYDISLKGFEITELINEKTPVSYLESLAEAGYLTNFPAYSWDDLQKAGVTAEFIQDLDNRGILEGLEFYEVINLYEKSN